MATLLLPRAYFLFCLNFFFSFAGGSIIRFTHTGQRYGSHSDDRLFIASLLNLRSKRRMLKNHQSLCTSKEHNSRCEQHDTSCLYEYQPEQSHYSECNLVRVNAKL